MKKLIPGLILLSLLFAACEPDADIAPRLNEAGNTILVDASKDGGGWWFPQTPPVLSASAPHQGKAMADFLRHLGYQVDELHVGDTITLAKLNNYRCVIRASGFYNYSASEVQAYQLYLNGGGSLLLTNDHMQYTTNDLLSATLGVDFEGTIYGNVDQYATHAITQSATPFYYNAGSFVRNPDPARLTVLGWVNTNAVMGIVRHPVARIFFIGDINGIEGMPQPFMGNLFNWLLN